MRIFLIACQIFSTFFCAEQHNNNMCAEEKYQEKYIEKYVAAAAMKKIIWWKYARKHKQAERNIFSF